MKEEVDLAVHVQLLFLVTSKSPERGEEEDNWYIMESTTVISTMLVYHTLGTLTLVSRVSLAFLIPNNPRDSNTWHSPTNSACPSCFTCH